MLRGTNTTAYALLCILVVHAALGTLFAIKTPPWQNPDEPAHYNYIAHVATERQLPVLQMGDYDGTYLERLKAEKFPPDLSIAPVRYEFHQPPLYYLLAVPIFWLSQGQLLALRLFNVFLGACVVLLVFLCARAAVPGSPHIALGAAAFAAFLPMHVALMASVNNDALAELLIAGTVLALLRWQRMGGEGDMDRRPAYLLAAGTVIGLGFLTKATTYALLTVGLVVVIIGTALPGRNSENAAGKLILQLALLIAPALLLGLPWWIRNSTLYGNLDILGLAWHDAVVTGQPTAAAWIAENGWGAYWERGVDVYRQELLGGIRLVGRIHGCPYLYDSLHSVGAGGSWPPVPFPGEGARQGLAVGWVPDFALDDSVAAVAGDIRGVRLV